MATSCVAGHAVDIVSTDPDLLTLEFEAIVAANFPSSVGRERRCEPAVRCAAATRVAPPGDRASRQPVEVRETGTVGRRPHARERSPPARTPLVSTGLREEVTSTGSTGPRRHPTAHTPRRQVRVRHPTPSPGEVDAPVHDRPAPRGACLGDRHGPRHWPRPSSDIHDPRIRLVPNRRSRHREPTGRRSVERRPVVCRAALPQLRRVADPRPGRRAPGPGRVGRSGSGGGSGP